MLMEVIFDALIQTLGLPWYQLGQTLLLCCRSTSFTVTSIARHDHPAGRQSASGASTWCTTFLNSIHYLWCLPIIASAASMKPACAIIYFPSIVLFYFRR
jgi:hypothetical protein